MMSELAPRAYTPEEHRATLQRENDKARGITPEMRAKVEASVPRSHVDAVLRMCERARRPLHVVTAPDTRVHAMRPDTFAIPHETHGPTTSTPIPERVTCDECIAIRDAEAIARGVEERRQFWIRLAASRPPALLGRPRKHGPLMPRKPSAREFLSTWTPRASGRGVP